MTSHDRDPRDDRLERLVHDAMHAEADTVTPAGDGLARIQQQVARRRARVRWLRPMLALGSAAVVAAVGVGTYAVTTHRHGNDRLVTGASPTPRVSSPGPSPSASTEPVTATTFPKLAIFPFTTPAQERQWEAAFVSGGHEPWKADAVAVATFWVDNYLGQPSVDQLVSKQLAADGGSATVTLGRATSAEQGGVLPVTAVHLVRFGKGWVVVSAADPQRLLSLATPKSNHLASSPLTVAGPGFGSDEQVRVQVRAATLPTSYGEAAIGFGSGTPQWHVAVDFTQPAEPIGVVVAVETSQADGGPQRIVARKVSFNSASGSPTPLSFYAVKDERVARFDARTGAFVDYLTPASKATGPGAGVADPQLSPTTGDVYYVQTTGTCNDALMTVPSTGGASTQVATNLPGYRITSYAVDPKPPTQSGNQATPSALFETACAPSQPQPQAKLVLRDAVGGTRVIGFATIPPGIESDPSFVPGWIPDSTGAAAPPRYLDAWVRTGNSGYLARYDVVHDTSATPARNACPSYDVNAGLPTALEVDAEGTLWFAVQTATSMQVVRCHGGHSTVAFTVQRHDSPQDVDVTADGQDVLLTDSAGRVWRWDGSGAAVRLATTVPIDQLTW